MESHGLEPFAVAHEQRALSGAAKIVRLLKYCLEHRLQVARQRPAAVHKDVLSQADILIAMKLTASQDRDAIGAWIEGQADRREGKRILGDLPRLQRGEGYVWAPGYALLDRVAFPLIRTFDSSRTPRRGEGLVIPRTLAEVDLTAIVAALAAAGAEDPRTPMGDASRHAQLEQELAAARAHIAVLEEENRELRSRLAEISALAAGVVPAPVVDPVIPAFAGTKGPRSRTVKVERPPRVVAPDSPEVSGTSIHPAARKLLTALAQHAPARFTWGQAATLAGLKPSGGHFNSGRKDLRAAGYVAETNGLVTPTPDGLKAAGEVPPAPSTPADRLALWCSRLPAPAPEMLRTLAAQGECYLDDDELAAILGKKPSGGHWNSGIAVLRNNGLIEIDGRRYRPASLFRE